MKEHAEIHHHANFHVFCQKWSLQTTSHQAMDRRVKLTFFECHLASFEFMIAGCKSDLNDSVKDSCDGSGLTTSESFKSSRPFHFIELVTWNCSLYTQPYIKCALHISSVTWDKSQNRIKTLIDRVPWSWCLSWWETSIMRNQRVTQANDAVAIK